jgi:hypothetical protein
MTVRPAYMAALFCMVGPCLGIAMVTGRLLPLVIWLAASLVAIVYGKEGGTFAAGRTW